MANNNTEVTFEIMEHAKQPDITLLIDTALNTIEKNNEQLKGALPDNNYSRLNLDTTKQGSPSYT